MMFLIIPQLSPNTFEVAVAVYVATLSRFFSNFFCHPQKMQRKLQGIFSKAEHIPSRVYQNY